MSHTSAPTASSTRSPWWHSLGSLSVAALVLVATNGLYMLLVAFGNITDYATNYMFVERVFAMDTTNFGQGQGVNLDPDIMWRAIDSPVAANAAYIGLIAIEALAGIVLIIAAVTWARYMRGSVSLAGAKALSTLGLVLITLVFFTGFITIGGEWFSMWRSSDWNGLDPALQNAMLAIMTLVVVHLVRDKRVTA
jgi:predicted small integral membrane protein